MARHALRTNDDELRDLAEGLPQLVEATHGGATGARFLRLLGNGGMATVFLADLDTDRRSANLDPETPARLAIKVMQLSTERTLQRFGVDPLKFFSRETVALSRVMERTPPTEFVVACYGSGLVEVQVVDGRTRRLPWLAIEYVDGGTSGVSVTDRVARVGDGIDPVRALRLLSGILEGARVLHEEGVIHRDIKPDNVLVAGSVDDETPKLADCGIARVAGLTTNMQAATPEYCGPEQNLSIVGNPLVGPWTDVHALAAVAWFVLGGEQWCSGAGDVAWHQGHRRSLRTAHKLHRGFRTSDSLLLELDQVLRAGAAQRLPEIAWASPDARAHEGRAMALFPGMFNGPPRFGSVSELAAALLPLLNDAAARWKAKAAKEQRAVTAFRPTQRLGGDALGASAPLAIVREHAASEIVGTQTPVREAVSAPMTPGCVVFQPDGKVLARVGSRLLYFVQDVPHKVRVDPDVAAARGRDPLDHARPRRGLCADGPAARAPRPRWQPDPDAAPRHDGGSASHLRRRRRRPRVRRRHRGDGGQRRPGALALHRRRDMERARGAPAQRMPRGQSPTAPSASSSSARWANAVARCSSASTGRSWSTPRRCSSGRRCSSRCAAPIARPGARARASCCASIAAWPRPSPSRPPPRPSRSRSIRWAYRGLVTEHAVLRRHVDGGLAGWRTYYSRPGEVPALLAIGFTPDGARVLDASGGTVHLTPHDAEAWGAAADTALFMQARP